VGAQKPSHARRQVGLSQTNLQSVTITGTSTNAPYTNSGAIITITGICANFVNSNGVGEYKIWNNAGTFIVTPQ
jgi:hypothetical protein